MTANREATVASISSEETIDTGHVTIPLVIPRSASSRIRAATFTSADLMLPKIPVPSSPLELPPQTSAYVLAGTNATKKLFPKFGNGFVDPGSLGWTVDPPIPGYTLAYRLYWQRTDIERVEGPQSFEFSAKKTIGMSQTDTFSISGELGVDVEGLSAELSATFSTSITVSQEDSITKSYEIDVPAGKIGIWVLWQLIEEIVAIDASGKQVQWSGDLLFQFINGLKPIRFPSSLVATLVTQGDSIFTPQITLFDQ